MAEDKSKSLRKRKVETIRERSDKASNQPVKTRRVQQTAGSVAKPFRRAWQYGQKEYYVPMPDNKVGRFLNKRRYWIPRYFKNAWQELRLVTWPDRKETRQLTFAVFIFAIVFGVLVTITDFGLDKVFKKVFVK